MENALGNRNILLITTVINPIFPVPCEIISKNYCRYYINQEAFDCINNVKDTSPINSLFKIELSEYKPISIWLFIIHFILLFTLGYLISAVILRIFRNIKIK